MCDFESNRKNGLAIQMGFKHRNIEQLDGAIEGGYQVFKCEICDFENNRMNNLTIHMDFNHRRN